MGIAMNALRPCLAVALVLGLARGARGEEPSTFERDVRPVFKAYCLDCHGGGEALKGRLDLRLRRFAVRGGQSGPAVVPGQPAESLLLERLKAGAMPPGAGTVPAAQVHRVERWVA